MSDANRQSLGITVPRRVPMQMAGESTRPVGSCDTGQRLRHILRWRNEQSGRRAKPANTMGCEVWCAVTGPADPVPQEPAVYSFVDISTTSSCTVSYEGKDIGKMAHCLLRWAGPGSEKGSWSEIISATIVG